MAKFLDMTLEQENTILETLAYLDDLEGKAKDILEKIIAGRNALRGLYAIAGAEQAEPTGIERESEASVELLFEKAGAESICAPPKATVSASIETAKRAPLMDLCLAHREATSAVRLEDCVTGCALRGCPVSKMEMERIMGDDGRAGVDEILRAMAIELPGHIIKKHAAATWLYAAGIVATKPEHFKTTIRRHMDVKRHEWEPTKGGHRKYIGKETGLDLTPSQTSESIPFAPMSAHGDGSHAFHEAAA